MDILLLIGVPLVAILWVLNLMTFIENVHHNKNTKNQKILGGLWTVVFLVLFTFSVIVLLDY